MLLVCVVFWVSVAAGRVVRSLRPVRRTISRVAAHRARGWRYSRRHGGRGRRSPVAERTSRRAALTTAAVGHWLGDSPTPWPWVGRLGRSSAGDRAERQP